MPWPPAGNSPQLEATFKTGLSHHADGAQDFLGEGDQQAAEHAQNPLGALGGVVGLDGHAQLYDAPAQDDHADGLDTGENKVGQIIHNGQRVTPAARRGQGRTGQNSAQSQR